MKLIYYFIICQLCFFITNGQSTTVIINAMADNTIYQSPIGNSNALGQNLFCGTNGGNSRRRALIKFNIATNIPTGANITSVSLVLHCNVGRVSTDNISLHKLLSNWGEATSDAGANNDGAGVLATTNDATWSKSFYPSINWLTAGGDYESIASATTAVNTEGLYNWTSSNMLMDIQNWLSNSTTNYGWIIVGNETTASTARRFSSKENTTLAERPSLAITYTTSVLPINLVSFTCIKANRTNLLQWGTSSEINSNSFELERQMEGSYLQWTKINLQAAVGYGANNYSYVDTDILNGVIYYRLKMTDVDGKFTYSNIIKLSNQVTNTITFYPNPASDFITVNGSLPNRFIQIFNANGQMVIAQKITNSVFSINIKALSKGMYYIRQGRDAGIKFLKK